MYRICTPYVLPCIGAHSTQHGVTFFEYEFPGVVCSVHADVLLDVRVLVVVDPDTTVTGHFCQPPDQTGFTR